MAQQGTADSGTLDDATAGALGTPPSLPKMADEGKGGFDYWLFGLLAAVAILVSIQNLWLRRRARRESGDSGGSS